MTGMEHAIEQVAVKVAAERRFGYPESSPRARFEIDAFSAGVEWAVGQLRESGLLAPAPLREQWTVAGTDGVGSEWMVDVEFDAREHAQRYLCQSDWMQEDNGHLQSRLVTDWEPLDRAEGDERADADRAADAIQAVLDGRAEVRWCAAEEVPSEDDGRADQ